MYEFYAFSPLLLMNSENWFYKGEGNANIILSCSRQDVPDAEHLLTPIIMRVRKESATKTSAEFVVSYQTSMQRLLSPYVATLVNLKIVILGNATGVRAVSA